MCNRKQKSNKKVNEKRTKSLPFVRKENNFYAKFFWSFFLLPTPFPATFEKVVKRSKKLICWSPSRRQKHMEKRETVSVNVLRKSSMNKGSRCLALLFVAIFGMERRETISVNSLAWIKEVGTFAFCLSFFDNKKQVGNKRSRWGQLRFIRIRSLSWIIYNKAMSEKKNMSKKWGSWLRITNKNVKTSSLQKPLGWSNSVVLFPLQKMKKKHFNLSLPKTKTKQLEQRKKLQK